MKNRMIISIISVLTIGLLAACGSSSSSGEGGMDLVEADKFTFASSGEFKPFSVTEGGGKMSGFDIDVAEAVAKELGLEPVQKKFKFAGIVEGVKTGRFDAAVASHTITDERAEHVDFSTPYYYSGPQIFVRPDSDIETIDDLKDKEVGVSKGSTYAKLASEKTPNVVAYDSDVTALEALSKGKHDAVITDSVTGAEGINSGFKIEGRELIGKSEQAIAVAKENEQLLDEINSALKTLKENGTLKEISEKYFGKDITVNPDEK
ncbi:transporter substrate-binding domain-containing protein [Metabacillus arenae]|uniref:Transporter substrate-binding domain-containing protein n=1 Tax=Metabacillus arenae TaxID=2771434 RepID=A0A926NCW7_9BACI|nr:transporter substrate-binding domain-containing protein [Metabacillus arenae]MBD1381179.1 transporter substrate-binding domain-containing protein [Metabacillus arenae]